MANEWMSRSLWQLLTIVHICALLMKSSLTVNEKASARLNRTKAAKQNKAKRTKKDDDDKAMKQIYIIRSDCMLETQEDGEVIVWWCVCLNSAVGTLPYDAMTIVISVILARRLLSANLFTRVAKRASAPSCSCCFPFVFLFSLCAIFVVVFLL